MDEESSDQEIAQAQALLNALASAREEKRLRFAARQHQKARVRHLREQAYRLALTGTRRVAAAGWRRADPPRPAGDSTA